MNTDLSAYVDEIFGRMGAKSPFDGDGDLQCRTPIDGSVLGSLRSHTPQQADAVIAEAEKAFTTWQTVPAPVRGAVVRELGLLLREHKSDLGALVSVEAGKILSEGQGEVQEMIDICDLAVGLSRQLHGVTIASERPGHRLMEQWHPLGVVGVISAFNFPVAVWSWNTTLALVCGDPVVWKPSEQTPLTALACRYLVDVAASRVDEAPENLCQVLIGDSRVGEVIVDDPRVALVSATGSTRMGKEVAPRVAARLGRSVLELGGNNAAIIGPSADLDLTVRGIVFSAVGTAGQRCTTLRRVIVHESVRDELIERLASAYRTLPIGSPLEESTLVGPLIGQRAVDAFESALNTATGDGGRIVVGGTRAEGPDNSSEGGCYVSPAIVHMPEQTEIVRAETFAPILWVMDYRDFDEAIAMHNSVEQGLSSSIFTLNMREAEKFVSATGSDCGMANVNIGPSGAEIGGAFGGEKDTGSSRESGSDAWRAYMRRTTNTVNYSTQLPLAQGVEFT